MQQDEKFIGLIEYQPKYGGGEVQVLWVLTPEFTPEDEAENFAEKLLQEIIDITPKGKVIYSDGVML